MYDPALQRPNNNARVLSGKLLIEIFPQRQSREPRLALKQRVRIRRPNCLQWIFLSAPVTFPVTLMLLLLDTPLRALTESRFGGCFRLKKSLYCRPVINPDSCC